MELVSIQEVEFKKQKNKKIPNEQMDGLNIPLRPDLNIPWGLSWGYSIISVIFNSNINNLF